MKTFGLKSKKYKNKKVQFGPFVMDFDAEGFAEVNVEDGKESQLAHIVETYKDFICFLEDEQNIDLQKQKEKDVEYLNKTIEEKDKEIEALKIANKNLSSKVIALTAQVNAYKEIKKDSAPIKNDLNKEVTAERADNAEKKDEAVFTEQELQKKTVTELQDILNTVFSDYKNEWTPLKKKDDIILYITQKVKD